MWRIFSVISLSTNYKLLVSSLSGSQREDVMFCNGICRSHWPRVTDALTGVGIHENTAPVSFPTLQMFDGEAARYML